MTPLTFLLRAVLAAGFGLALAIPPAGAQTLPGKPDPVRGAEIAESLCASCHLLPGTRAVPEQVEADVPTFQEIANLEGQTVERLRGRMIVPAHPMPEIPLERSHIEHLAAYIISLRKPE